MGETPPGGNSALAGFLVVAIVGGFAGISWALRDAVVAQNRAELEAERAKTSLEILSDPFDNPSALMVPPSASPAKWAGSGG